MILSLILVFCLGVGFAVPPPGYQPPARYPPKRAPPPPPSYRPSPPKQPSYRPPASYPPSPLHPSPCYGKDTGSFEKEPCSQTYITCWNGHEEPAVCPSKDQVFDKTECRDRSLVAACGYYAPPPPPKPKRPRPPVPPYRPRPTPKGPCAGLSNGLYEIKPCSQTYRRCWEYVEEIQSCAYGEVFYEKECHPLSYVPYCSTSYPPPSPPYVPPPKRSRPYVPQPYVPPPKPKPSGPCANLKNGDYQIEYCSQKYRRCWNYVEEILNCGYGEVFYEGECHPTSYVPNCPKTPPPPPPKPYRPAPAPYPPKPAPAPYRPPKVPAPAPYPPKPAPAPYRPPYKPPPPPKPKPSGPCAGLKNGDYQIEYCSQKYRRCWNYVEEILSCPYGEVFYEGECHPTSYVPDCPKTPPPPPPKPYRPPKPAPAPYRPPKPAPAPYRPAPYKPAPPSPAGYPPKRYSRAVRSKSKSSGQCTSEGEFSLGSCLQQYRKCECKDLYCTSYNEQILSCPYGQVFSNGCKQASDVYC